MKTSETNVTVTEDENGTWLTMGGKTISLDRSPGQNIHDFFQENLLRHPLKTQAVTVSKTVIAYATGTCALLLVLVSAAMAVFYAATHGWETLTNLATSTLTGIGMAIGGCLGSALILRFKAARHFIRSILKDLQ